MADQQISPVNLQTVVATLQNSVQALYLIATSISDAITGAFVERPLESSATYNAPNLADGDGVTTTVTCAGATLGDYADWSFSLDVQGITVTAYVSAVDTVSIRFQNETTGAIDLGSGLLRVRVWRKT